LLFLLHTAVLADLSFSPSSCLLLFLHLRQFSAAGEELLQKQSPQLFSIWSSVLFQLALYISEHTICKLNTLFPIARPSLQQSMIEHHIDTETGFSFHFPSQMEADAEIKQLLGLQSHFLSMKVIALHYQ
jgi:hypothetical protein